MKEKDPALYMLARASRCCGCDRKLPVNELARLSKKENEEEVHCTSCAGLSHLEFLPTGNAALTKSAKKYSKERFVVFKWSDLWKSYERKGMMLEKEAIRKAEAETESL